ncbi:D-tyrosyl-tRNA(Tyr) deacylase [Hahella sp. CCB-MM4]|uniref:D-aminoacyl-tRNA deacylase n=1 Tax=Hahella sp. (strain CCB-MM4) TaxID=1926491 RepID=UPI000B9B0143|nr:D-aminoacyl-tRNA deacylase [Hahella sp. CCB-MM4]OZG74931.1 D-tyrosyl-tRNA(Tyr) deacylase [Hahella sp. CCB-MM4]
MKGLLQRVSEASVAVDGVVRGEIGNGLVLFLAVEAHDDEQSADKLLAKVLSYRVFEDEQAKMNLSLLDVHGELMIVSQFTLAADTRKGMRPSFTKAAEPEKGDELYRYFVEQAGTRGVRIVTGEFGADMLVNIQNRGPATFLLEV